MDGGVVSTEARRRLPGLVVDTWVMCRRNLLRVIRLPQLLAFSTVQPIMLLLLFTYVFGGAIERSIPASAHISYVDYLLPGMLVQISVFGAGQTALGLTEDLGDGVLNRFRSLPIARPAVLAGRTLADLLRNAIVIALLVAVGSIIGFRWQTGFPGLLEGIAIVLLFAHALSWLMVSVGLAVRSPETAQAAVFLGVFPFVFASGVFVPPATMPAWLRGFAENQPVTAVVDAVRGLVLGGSASGIDRGVADQVLVAGAWCAGLLLVAVPLAMRVYRRAIS